MAKEIITSQPELDRGANHEEIQQGGRPGECSKRFFSIYVVDNKEKTFGRIAAKKTNFWGLLSDTKVGRPVMSTISYSVPHLYWKEKRGVAEIMRRVMTWKQCPGSAMLKTNG